MRKMKNSLLRLLGCFLLGMALLTGAVLSDVPTVALAAGSSRVTIQQFNSMLKEVTGQDAWLPGDSFYGSSEAITNEIACVMANRADEQLNGTAYDKQLYKNVEKYHRISDIKKATKAYRKSIKRCFVKGLMVGTSPKTYSQKRKLAPKSYLSAKAARSLVAKLKDKSKRIKLTEDGQVTRITNLPKNAKLFPYILASFPNSYYEPSMVYQRSRYEPGYIPVNLVDYAAPKDVRRQTENWSDGTFGDHYREYGDEWMANVKKNLKLRFNYDYRMSDQEFEKWRADLVSTFPESLKEKSLRGINNWRTLTKTYHSVVKASDVVVEPSGIYASSDGYYVRCYVRFKVSSNKYFSADSYDQNVYIFGSPTYFPGLKLNQWYNGVIDVSFGGWSIGGGGKESAVDSYGIGLAGY